jgi:hypothetical protein
MPESSEEFSEKVQEMAIRPQDGAESRCGQ